MQICIAVIRTDKGFIFYQPSLGCVGRMDDPNNISDSGYQTLLEEISKYKHLVFMPEVSLIVETKNYMRVHGIDIDNYIQNIWIEVGGE